MIGNVQYGSVACQARDLEDVTMLKKKLSKTPGYTVLPNDISSHL